MGLGRVVADVLRSGYVTLIPCDSFKKLVPLVSNKILITRLVGLGDVASILIPAVRLLKSANPDASIDVLTYQAGVELMSLSADVSNVLSISAEQWPSDLLPATQSFLEIAKVVAMQGYERVICLDTWFMPCFLARVLKDIGLNVEGNYIDMPAAHFLENLKKGILSAEYFQYTNYMESSYPGMVNWQKPWWQEIPGYAHYPDFYLRHCCGFMEYPSLANISVLPDTEFQRQSQGRKIIAVSFKGSTAIKHYKKPTELVQKLESAGYMVWSQFDGSLPMEKTLGRLAVSNLLITVATSTQWLARLVGCPSLMLPGAMHPSILGAEMTVAQTLDCQYCCQRGCPADRDYACMEVPVSTIMGDVRDFFLMNSCREGGR